MMRRRPNYTFTRDLSTEDRRLLKKCQEISDQYLSIDMRLSIPQLYYRLVAAHQVDDSQRDYDEVTTLCLCAHSAGWLPGVWNHWYTPPDAEDDIDLPLEMEFHENMFLARGEKQPVQPILLLDGTAILGILSSVCKKWRLAIFTGSAFPRDQLEVLCGGLILPTVKDRHQAIVLHLADHDPIGLEKTSYLQVCFEKCCGTGSQRVLVKRLGLTREQVNHYALTPRPYVKDDPDADDYWACFGRRYWDLEAFEPRALVQMLDASLRALMGPIAGYDGVDLMKDC